MADEEGDPLFDDTRGDETPQSQRSSRISMRGHPEVRAEGGLSARIQGGGSETEGVREDIRDSEIASQKVDEHASNVTWEETEDTASLSSTQQIFDEQSSELDEHLTHSFDPSINEPAASESTLESGQFSAQSSTYENTRDILGQISSGGTEANVSDNESRHDVNEMQVENFRYDMSSETSRHNVEEERSMHGVHIGSTESSRYEFASDDSVQNISTDIDQSLEHERDEISASFGERAVALADEGIEHETEVFVHEADRRSEGVMAQDSVEDTEETEANDDPPSSDDDNRSDTASSASEATELEQQQTDVTDDAENKEETTFATIEPESGEEPERTEATEALGPEVSAADTETEKEREGPDIEPGKGKDELQTWVNPLVEGEEQKEEGEQPAQEGEGESMQVEEESQKKEKEVEEEEEEEEEGCPLKTCEYIATTGEECLAIHSQEPWPNDVLLYQPYEVEQILLPDNANCLAVQAFLKMCDLKFEVEPRSNAENMSPSGRVPFIKCGAFVVSELDPIIAFVATKGVSLTNHLDSSQKADMRAYMSLVNNVLANAELYVCWCDSTTWSEVTKPRYGSVFPWPLNHVLCYQKRNQVSKRLGILGWSQKSLDEVYQEVDSCCNALSERLENKEFFFGSQLTDLDALVYGHLYAIVTSHLPTPTKTLSDVVNKFKPLIEYIMRIDRQVFQRSTIVVKQSLTGPGPKAEQEGPSAEETTAADEGTAGEEPAADETAGQAEETAGQAEEAEETAGQAEETAGQAEETAGQAEETEGQVEETEETAGQAEETEEQAEETAGQTEETEETAGQAEETEEQAEETAGQAEETEETAGQAEETAGQAEETEEQAEETAGQAEETEETAGQAVEAAPEDDDDNDEKTEK